MRRYYLVAILLLVLFLSVGLYGLHSHTPRNVDAAPVAVPEPASTSYVCLPLILKNYTGACTPGGTVTDPAGDVPFPYIDVVLMHTTLTGESLQGQLTFVDLPSELTFNRVGVPSGYVEYMWDIWVDVDDNTQTGCTWPGLEGAEYAIWAVHDVWTPDSPVTQPIQDGVQTSVFQYDPVNDSMSYLSDAIISVDADNEVMTLTGNIPGISPTSRVLFYTYDYNPGGFSEQDESSCAATSGAGLGALTIYGEESGRGFRLLSSEQ